MHWVEQTRLKGECELMSLSINSIEKCINSSKKDEEKIKSIKFKLDNYNRLKVI